MRRGFTSFLPVIVPALVVGAGTFLMSCSMTHEMLRTEKTTTEPAVISGPVEWNETIDIRAIPADETVNDNGTGVFEIEASTGAGISPPAKGELEGVGNAKVKFKYHLTYEPKKKVSMSIDSASVETKKETKTVTVNEKTTVEKKFYRYLSYILAGMVLALFAVLGIMRIFK